MSNLQHEKTSIEQFYQFLENLPQINAAVLFGSVARGDDNYHSDIDLALWVQKEMDIWELAEQINSFLGSGKSHVFVIPRKNSIAVFLDKLKKVDLLFIHDLNALNRNFLGSFIPEKSCDNAIVFDKTGTVKNHLIKIIKTPQKHPDHLDVDSLINYFLFSFEGCSKQHAKSDGYQFYFNYNIALHTLIQLKYFAKGNTRFLYNPKNISNLVWDRDDMEGLYQLKGSLFLQEANQQKRLLLEQFYGVVEILIPDKLNKYRTFCESVFERDYFWNFRDYNLHHTNLPSGKIIRSATLSIFPEKNKVVELLNKNNIDTIIDLRAPKEIAEIPYTPSILEGRKYIQAPFDPWDQPDWFKENHHQGTDREIAYRFFLMACQESFHKTVQSILAAEGAVLIHCHAGKDRTGLVVGALQLLLDSDENAVRKDYLASGSDVDLNVFDILFEQVQKHGDIQSFFNYQGIGPSQQSALIDKLTNP